MQITNARRVQPLKIEGNPTLLLVGVDERRGMKLGFTLSVYKQVLLSNRTSIVLDRDLGLTVQHNLRV